jgi:hypothetical protein
MSNPKITNPNPTVQIPTLAKAMQGEDIRIDERARDIRKLNDSMPTDKEAGLPDWQRHSPGEARSDHVSDKAYFFPDSYNNLREELQRHWPNVWNSPAQYMMVYDGPAFVALFAEMLDIPLEFDSAKVDAICKKIIDELRKKRGCPF